MEENFGFEIPYYSIQTKQNRKRFPFEGKPIRAKKLSVK